jgi:hypothetical protein
MTALVDLGNRALQALGTRTTMTAAELANQTSNESIQFNLIASPFRRQLLRLAPWGCGLKTANLVYITSAPGTPENVSAPTTLWQPGQPAPPWAYEYQYPVDCLKACWLIPATQTGFAGGVPITTAVTGGAASFWQGPPVKFVIQTDTFQPVTGATVAAPGSGYAVGDLITLSPGPASSPPIGAPAQLTVATLSGSGVATVSVVNQVGGETTPLGGSYFGVQAGAQAQASTSGLGQGATFNLTQAGASPQRIILTNQEFATMVYVQDVSDPNVWDDMFQEALIKAYGAGLVMALTGDKKLANGLIQELNQMIDRARTPDGNEGFTVNDVTPDWIRIRGVQIATAYSGPFTGYDWSGQWPIYG